MNIATRRAELAETVAAAVREAMTETGIKSWPDETILLVSSYADIAEFDDLLGWQVFVVETTGSKEVDIAFPSGNINHYPLLKAFRSAMEFL